MDDFDDFCNRVGTDKAVYRYCEMCDDLIIVDPEKYEGPTVHCDCDDCPYTVPFCVCEGQMIYEEEALKECEYPNCPCSSQTHNLNE